MSKQPFHARPAPRTALVRRLMSKHGLPEPYARLVAALYYREGNNG